MALKARLIILICAICLPQILWAKDGAAHQVKADTLRYLQDLRTQNVKRLREIDETLSNKVEIATPNNVENDVRALKTAKHEHLLRQEFLDRLIFQIDTKFAGGDLRAFLERALTEMAKVDAVSSAVDNGLWKFMKFAADAVRSLPERKENIVSFLEGYMKRSVSNPVRPDDYLNSRNYTNGAVSEAGQPLPREDVGAIVENRIRDISKDVEVKTAITAESAMEPAVAAPTAAPAPDAAIPAPTPAPAPAYEDAPTDRAPDSLRAI